MEHINIRSKHSADASLEIAELISADASEMLNALLDGNDKFHVLNRMFKFNAAGCMYIHMRNFRSLSFKLSLGHYVVTLFLE